MLKKALHNQSVFDFLQQHCGNITDALVFAKANELSITDNLIPGNYYAIPVDIVNNTDILNYYTNNAFVPATAIIGEGMSADFGIGEMSIGNTFLVR